LPYYVRMMRQEDIAQVNEIDREAFPTQLPPPNYHHELQNRLARYIVAYSEDEAVAEPEVKAAEEKDSCELVHKIRKWFNHKHLFGNEPATPERQHILGFAGIWIMADEAHITNIAVRKCHQRQGIGELLLILIIDLATKLKANTMTLEVRASNTAAQSLYQKYGFTQVGLRHAYYTDNREDGVLMSTESITSAPFQAHLQQLKRAHSRKYGVALYGLSKDLPFDHR